MSEILGEQTADKRASGEGVCDIAILYVTGFFEIRVDFPSQSEGGWGGTPAVGLRNDRVTSKQICSLKCEKNRKSGGQIQK